MRILLLTWLYPPLVGGAERQAQRLAHALAKRGNDLEVWTAHHPGSPRLEHPVSRVTLRRRFRGLEWGPLFGASVTIQVAAAVAVASRRFDVIHCHQGYFHSLGAILARSVGGPPVVIRLVSSGFSNDLLLMRQKKGGALLHRGLGAANAFVVLCRRAEEELHSQGIPVAKINRIPNGIEIESFYPEPPPDLASPPVILFVGRLGAEKGGDILLKAYALTVKTFPSARLRMVGDGPVRHSLEDLARILSLRVISPSSAEPPGANSPDSALSNLSPSAPQNPPEPGTVEFCGASDNPRPHYPRAAVVVLPSRTEGMSNVMLEAMAMGRPIVATAVGGNCDLMDPENQRSRLSAEAQNDVFQGPNGFLVPPENPEAMAQAIIRTLENRERSENLGAASRKWVEQNCSLESVAQQYENLYRRIIR